MILHQLNQNVYTTENNNAKQ